MLTSAITRKRTSLLTLSLVLLADATAPLVAAHCFNNLKQRIMTVNSASNNTTKVANAQQVQSTTGQLRARRLASLCVMRSVSMLPTVA
jgi:hypothetical protein